MVRNPHIKVVLFRLVTGIFIFLLPSSIVSAQNNMQKQDLSSAEKWWALGHIFIAKKAYRIAIESLNITDSLEQIGFLDGDGSGGQLDAFKHAFWMASLGQEIGERKAKKLGIAHEKGNYRSFKKAIRKGKENNHDKASSDMDLWNNEAGIEIAQANPNASADELIQLINKAILESRMKIILKNKQGQFLDSNGAVIDMGDLKNVWDNGKVLVYSGSVQCP